MRAVATGGMGFLLAVIWFDLMFDSQVARRPAGPLPDPVVRSIAAYYRRVTTDAAPMNRLVPVAMVAALAGLLGELAGDAEPVAAVLASAGLAVAPMALAGARTVRRARRLGQLTDPEPIRSALARSVWRDHVMCFTTMAAALAIQFIVVR